MMMPEVWGDIRCFAGYTNLYLALCAGLRCERCCVRSVYFMWTALGGSTAGLWDKTHDIHLTVKICGYTLSRVAQWVSG